MRPRRRVFLSWVGGLPVPRSALPGQPPPQDDQLVCVRAISLCRRAPRGAFEILCHAARHTLRPCVRPRRCSQRAPPSRVTPPATHSGLVCGRAGVCSFLGTRHHPLSPPCLCVLGGSMLCASAAPDVPGLIINATLYMSIHGSKPELPGQPGILYRGERASRVGGSCTMALPAPACLPPARSMDEHAERQARPCEHVKLDRGCRASPPPGRSISVCESNQPM